MDDSVSSVFRLDESVASAVAFSVICHLGNNAYEEKKCIFVNYSTSAGHKLIITYLSYGICIISNC